MYFILNGTVIPNHGYVMNDDIGSNDAALLCNTDQPPPQNSIHSGGDWFAPDGTRVSGEIPVPGFVRNRGPMVVRLRRRQELANEGIYYCTVSDAKEKRQQIYVGLYYPGEGTHIQIFSIIFIM